MKHGTGDGDWIRRPLEQWDARLEIGPFLGGTQPGQLDYQLLGQGANSYSGACYRTVID